MVIILIQIIHWVVRIILLLVLVDVVVSYFMSPYSSVRMWLDRIVQPMLSPLRRVIPPIGMIDITPIVFIIGLQLLESLVTALLLRLVR